MRASVLTPFVEIDPGAPTNLRFEVVNTLDIVDLISIDVPGLDPSEVRFDRESVSLFPDESAVITMTLKLRKTFPSGPGTIDVRIASALRPELVEVEQVQIDVAPFAAAELVVRPQAIVAKSKVTIDASVRNTGNTPLSVSMLARDDQRHLRFELHPPSLVVLPETEAHVRIDGKGRRPFFGTPDYRTIYISADSEAGTLQDTVTLTQRPILVRGLLTAGILLAIIALWALIVTFGVDLVLDSEPAPKALPADFASPVSYATLASLGSAGAVGGSGASAVQAILGTMSGTVVGADNGEPLPRIAVEAHRPNRRAPDAPIGSDETRVQSAATDEQGAFTLEGLFPGTYSLKLVGLGFEELWYPGVSSPGAATPVELGASESLTLDPVAIAGQFGRITGTIDTGDQLVPITVVVRPLVNDVPGFEVARVEVLPVDADGDGFADGPASYEIAGLASPLDYSLTFTSEQFADQVITEQLAAGAALTATPVRLLPGEGGITGSIVLTGARPSSGVLITATSGGVSFVLETPTPTADPTTPDRSTVGFSLSGLPSPGTFSLRFEADGFEPTFGAVDITAGGEGDVGVIELRGGGRRLAGTVVDQDTGLRVGDVDVAALGPDGEVATKTLPAPTQIPTSAAGSDCRTPDPVAAYQDGSGAGTFSFDSLGIGVHSITFTKPGYTSVTHRVDIDGAGRPTVLTPGFEDGVVELRRTIGEVCGTVLGPGGALRNGSVVLRGGPRPPGAPAEDRAPTPLSSEPAGSYKITDLAAGEYTLTASADGHRRCTVVFRVEPGSRDARLRLIDMQLVLSSAPSTASCTTGGGA